jgi:hypothetical protein
MPKLHVGGRQIDRSEAMEFATTYLTDGTGWGYPSYDDYERRRARGPLTQADLLAPVLLNVGRTYNLKMYQALVNAIPRLQDHLDHIPADARLADATADELTLLGELFAVLDGQGLRGSRGTVLAKILHRKRPDFIPLYDKYVDRVYRGPSPAPIQPDRRRTWREFMILFGRAVQRDLRAEQRFWEEVVALAPHPAISDVRALDIVAWWAGRRLPG